ncbi:MAG: nicotinate-nucleotide--dimethylbenzimidazole phosphoribosyltransferase [Betaproteobacteria bacterium]|nr:MAG: nicotinate-nucleotide--dimethylbenzimidazole phosphoribosyltransferase [Betaproteobacteria bacterium]
MSTLDRWNAKTKPPGSLGKIEWIATRLAAIEQTDHPQATPAVALLFAADHGVHAEGVSPYPQAVTAQMVSNIVHGGAASSVLAKLHGIEHFVIDVGVASEIAPHPRLVNRAIRRSTHNFAVQPAMSEGEFERVLAIGRECINAQAAQARVVLVGEMGIANTSSASAVAAALLGLPAHEITGAGTGLDATGITHKVAVIDAALALHTDRDPRAVLRCLGGFEIVAMCGAYLEASAQRKALLIDGFIATVALLAAARMDPTVLDVCIFSHQSSERGHRAVLNDLSAEPLLSLGMRLGEATGALMAYPLLVQSCTLLAEMATFAEAAVDNRAGSLG